MSSCRCCEGAGELNVTEVNTQKVVISSTIIVKIRKF
ncbi:hypothetical protein LCGC14_1176380 [marine sediment metagenome]|uniref:Uncharacterized protein n=1 Tax=marine sediment metagenome TaxID=412755 RepID=A0A0F9PTS1_9ZZZZ